MSMDISPTPWVGLTGGIACGKSAVGKVFADLGIAVIDADQVARDVVKPGRAELETIAQQFGNDFITAEGELDRAKMRSHVFADPDERKKLEAILHPAIRTELVSQCKAAEQGSPYVIAMVPILEKLGIQSHLHRTVVVDAAEDVQLMRLCQRDNMTEDAAQSMIDAQQDRRSRLAMADDVIRNNNSLAEMRRQVEELHQKYTNQLKTS
ncbi:MAG: dephospho-CoA kinase [Gammaproteobacteria bacterium]|nr:dephospho-CoA kinase [Gammaproteobacteria bacterium]